MIQIQNLHFGYRKKKIFTGLSLTLEAGHIYGLLGKNGTGKSTLLRNMAGLLFPKDGTVNVLGFNPAKRQPAFLRDLFQGGSAQAMPVVRNVGFGLVHLAGNLIYVVVVPILSFLMILQAPVFDELLVAMRHRRNGAFWTDVLHGLMALLSLATLVAYGLVLSLMGVPFALLLAGAAAVLEVIPVLGPLAAAAAIVGVALFSGYGHVGWIVAFIGGYRVFQDYMLNPYLMSEGVDVPPILVVFGLLAGEELAGVSGIFLSVPFLAAVRMVGMQVRLHRAKITSPATTPSAPG